MGADLGPAAAGGPGQGWVRRHPVAAYFLLTYAISWAAAFAVAAPRLMRHEPLNRLTGILMFPAMLLGPLLAGIGMTAAVEGASGVRQLFRRMGRYGIGARWYAALLLPPVLVLAVLLLLQRTASAAYAPNFFWLGVLFGVPAGLIEEIGWMGFAYPHMAAGGRPWAAALGLGVLWSCWHLPVVNFLGTAVPHGQYWLAYFLAFACVMTAMRAIICWLYRRTESLALAQWMHISSTGALVIFSATRVTPGQEAYWYFLYATLLWLVAAGLAWRERRAPGPVQPPAAGPAPRSA